MSCLRFTSFVMKNCKPFARNNKKLFSKTFVRFPIAFCTSTTVFTCVAPVTSSVTRSRKYSSTQSTPKKSRPSRPKLSPESDTFWPNLPIPNLGAIRKNHFSGFTIGFGKPAKRRSGKQFRSF